jgi:hypothetical protein
MEQGVVVALDPELVDGVWDTQRQLLFVDADGTDVLKPAAERVDAHLRLEGGGDLAPEGNGGVARGWIFGRVCHGRRDGKKRGRSRQSGGEDEETEVCGKLMHRLLHRLFVGNCRGKLEIVPAGGSGLVEAVQGVRLLFYLVFPVGFRRFSLAFSSGEGRRDGQLSQPPQGGLSGGLIPKLCGVFHKLFTGPTPSSGAGTEAKIISIWNKQKGV